MAGSLNDADRLEAPEVGPPELDPRWDEISYEIMGRQFYRHYDKSGNPISMRDYCRLRMYDEAHDHEYTVVQQDHVGDYFVSTVWIGLDHGFGEGLPLIFETMVFNQGDTHHPWADLECVRYSTEEEAVAGHAAMLMEVQLIAALEE